MSSDHSIAVSNLSKRYIIQHERSILLKDLLFKAFRPKEEEEFWALHDINFAIAKGKTVGVVGHNGSGKSTLLKILNRVTTPTTGEVTIHGKVAALLELGAGFHYNLTGRENIYLNAAILGLKRRETDALLADIVAFSGIERFIDTPVRNYSSGMFVRLGFAIAVHLDPDVLIIDEVLAVGDADFQKKCLEKIAQFQEQGKTIFLVSHSIGTIQKNCHEAILLNQGKLIAHASPDEVAAIYADLQKAGLAMR